MDSKTLHQQNPPVLNQRCQLRQVDLCNGHKTVVVVVQSVLTDFSRCAVMVGCLIKLLHKVPNGFIDQFSLSLIAATQICSL